MIVFQDRELISIAVVNDIRVRLIKGRRMVKESIGTSMGQNMRVDGLMIRRMDLVNSVIPMEIFMKEIG